jgi:hypothetical protein
MIPLGFLARASTRVLFFCRRRLHGRSALRHASNIDRSRSPTGTQLRIGGGMIRAYSHAFALSAIERPSNADHRSVARRRRPSPTVGGHLSDTYPGTGCSGQRRPGIVVALQSFLVEFDCRIIRRLAASLRRIAGDVPLTDGARGSPRYDWFDDQTIATVAIVES